MKKIIAIVGARPQFIKHAAIDLAARGKVNLITIHTGQHYDKNMSDVFFDQLKMSIPDYTLETGGYSHGKQTGMMMIEIEELVMTEKPNAILVYGDTNSTLAGALVASKLHIPLFHVEAGLRSYNKLMPEEINRVITDHVSDLLFTTSPNAVENLKKEGIQDGVSNVGDVMYDMIITASKIVKQHTKAAPYIYVTLHRPYNVDNKDRITRILKAFQAFSTKVVFPIHPRTRNKMIDFGLKEDDFPNISFVKPVSYFENIQYLLNSEGLVTDSGGMQKEAYWLKKKCVTIRSETEWIETLANGWNTLLFEDFERLEEVLFNSAGRYKQLYGEGDAAGKIVMQAIAFLDV